MGDRFFQTDAVGQQFSGGDSLLDLRMQLNPADAARLSARLGTLADLDFTTLWDRLAAVMEKHVQKNIDQRRGKPPHGFRKLSDATKHIRQKTGIPGIRPLRASGALYGGFAITRSDATSMTFANTARSDTGVDYPAIQFKGALVPITQKLRAFFRLTFGINLRGGSKTFGSAFQFLRIPPRNPLFVTAPMEAEAGKVAQAWLAEQVAAA